MNTLQAYKFSENRLAQDYPAFEAYTGRLIDRYGEDYDKFLTDIEQHINLFTRKWGKTGRYLNNTYVDSMFQYLVTRNMLEKRGDGSVIFEFSPFRGWSTYNMLRAIKDSGRKNVRLISYELEKSCFAEARKNLAEVADHVAYESLELVRGDALDGLRKLPDESVDLMFIDSFHGRQFTYDYINAGSFRVCKPNAYVHIHDFVFWLNGCPEKYQEPEAIAEYVADNPQRFANYKFGQLFWLLGGRNSHDELVEARNANEKSKYFSNSNFFVRNNLPEKYWLGGSIAGVSRKGVHENKTWLSGLALWMIPQ